MIFAMVLAAATSNVGSINAGDKLCPVIEKISRTIMENKQAGTPLSKIMETTGKVEDKATNELLKAIVLEAYSAPDYSSHEMKQRQVTEFSASVAVVCYKTFNK